MRKTFWFIAAWVLLLVGPAMAATMGSVGKERVKVHSQPDANSKVLFQVYLGYPIKINKQKKDWVCFTDWKRHSGWIKRSMVSKTRTAVVLFDKAPIRQGPSPKKPVIKQASKGDIFKIYGDKGQWVKLGYYLENDVAGWIRQDQIWGD